ncbi:MAG: acyl-CoA dehydrogenase family protein [Thermoleophilia bacterium]|nr:acyl-CoA dehydrogenase family protein [Thermoleophilia bacterium]
MRFSIAEEPALFAISLRGALSGWEPPLEPTLATWWDEHDEALAGRVEALGWGELWLDAELLPVCVAGGAELGRALAPLSLLDRATLGGPLAVGERVRHPGGPDDPVALATPGSVGLARVEVVTREPALDGTGTCQMSVVSAEPVPDGAARLHAWAAATLGYLHGLAARSLEATVSHAASREQFGGPLAALPAVQARLADAALAVDGIELVAWESVSPGQPVTVWRDALAWAPGAACEVTASAHQVHGAVGFALESGVHRAHRRAWSARAWAAEVLRATA